MLDETQSSQGLPTPLLDPDSIMLQSKGKGNQLCWEIRSRNKTKSVICVQLQQFMANMARAQIKSSGLRLTFD